jgi:23S rRNA (cytidine1920-2'-O)/16S rRNA (cytidine1409-2'-O)-methyltransferase
MTVRLDRALVERGFATGRGRAQELIAAGRVRVNGVTAAKPSQPVGEPDRIEADADHYVSRAAHKLIAALDESGTPVPARVLDAGASTGGFTQVLLERGAETVYAADVGHGQLVPALRADPRVRVLEGLNLKDLTPAHVGGEPVGLITADVSFISLTQLIAPLAQVLAPGGTALLLVKPQFEAGRAKLGKGGVVTDPGLHAAAVARVKQAAAQSGWTADWEAPSRTPGEHGNQEFFVRFAH